MDKEKRIAELEERKRQIDVEIAFYNGLKVEFNNKNDSFLNGFWNEKIVDSFNWEACDYRTAEEPKRIPFDGSDAFNLTLQKFRHKGSIGDDIFVCMRANESGVYIDTGRVDYKTLSEKYEKWNDLTKVWQPCNKVA